MIDCDASSYAMYHHYLSEKIISDDHTGGSQRHCRNMTDWRACDNSLDGVIARIEVLQKIPTGISKCLGHSSTSVMALTEKVSQILNHFSLSMVVSMKRNGFASPCKSPLKGR